LRAISKKKLDPKTTSPLQSIAAKNFRRNYALGITNGAFFGLFDSIASPYVVLPLFVHALGGSNFLVGLLPALANGGWFLPQFLISHRLQRLTYKLPVYSAAAILRVICFTALPIATFMIGDKNPALLLTIFFALFTIYWLAAGVAGTPFMDIVAKIIPANRRGSFFGQRDLTGALAGIGAGFALNYLLDPATAPAFPNNFGWILLLAAGINAIGLAAFAFVIELPEQTRATPVNLREQFRAARRILREDHPYRRYLFARIVLNVTDIATPFFALYAAQVLRVPAETVGLYIAMTTAASLISNPLLSRLSDTRGNRLVLLCASIGSVAMPALALAFVFLPAGAHLAIPFGVVFILMGIVRTAANIAMPSFLLDIAPAAERPLYIGFTNSILGIATLLPITGGIVVDAFGYPALLFLNLLIAALAVALTLTMKDSRVR